MAAQGSTVETFRQSVTLLRTRRFGTFWFGSLLANIGTWSQEVAQPWLMLTLTGSAFMVGLDAFAMAAPVWLLTLVGGALADRGDRRLIILGFQSLQMLCPVALLVLLLTGTLQPWMIIVLSVVVGVTDGLSMPAFKSIVPSMVPREQIGAGIALNSTQFNLSRIIGPSMAGLLLVGVGAEACFAVSAVSYLPFILIALWVLPRKAPEPVAAPRSFFSGLKEIVHEPVLRGALLSGFVNAAFCHPLITFCPVLVTKVFAGDAASFSRAIAAFGVGGLLGSLLLLGLEGRFDRRKLCNRAGGLYGAVVVLAAFVPVAWALPLLLVFAGVFMVVSDTQGSSIFQLAASPSLRGQTVGLMMFSVRAGVSVGSMFTGVTSHFLGIQQALLINGVLALGLHAWLSRRWAS